MRVRAGPTANDLVSNGHMVSIHTRALRDNGRVNAGINDFFNARVNAFINDFFNARINDFVNHHMRGEDDHVDEFVNEPGDDYTRGRASVIFSAL